MITLLKERSNNAHCHTSSAYVEIENNMQIIFVMQSYMKECWKEMFRQIYLIKLQILLIPHNFSFRKLSSVSLNYFQTSLFFRGENMIKKQCSVNPNLTDLFDIDEFGNEKLVFCSNTGVWE